MLIFIRQNTTLKCSFLRKKNPCKTDIRYSLSTPDWQLNGKRQSHLNHLIVTFIITLFDTPTNKFWVVSINYGLVCLGRHLSESGGFCFELLKSESCATLYSLHSLSMVVTWPIEFQTCDPDWVGHVRNSREKLWIPSR